MSIGNSLRIASKTLSRLANDCDESDRHIFALWRLIEPLEKAAREDGMTQASAALASWNKGRYIGRS